MELYDSLFEAIQTEYDIVKKIKESARGTVSIIRHRRTGTRYIFRQFAGESGVYRKLLAVSCKNLPRIMEVGEKGGQTIVLEEFIQGDTLAFLLEGGPLEVSEARDITKQLCRALWVLHSKGTVHRDIKPENIILRGNETVLIDFDASRIYKEEYENDTQILGTTGYAAPEQYGLSQSDGRADIYALGVLLNMMLTGRHPSKQLAEGKMGRIVQKCTMVNPKKRFKNVLHLMEVL